MFPEYTPTERRIDGAIHIAGIALTVSAIAVLLARTIVAGEALRLVAASVYGVGLASTFGASAAYHLTRGVRWKEAIRRADRVAIYLMIAGTYTPSGLIAIDERTGAALLAAVWLAALAGIALVLVKPRQFERAAIAVYLVLGWIGLAALSMLIAALPGTTLALLGAGGLLYTGGVAFHLWRRLPGQNAVWHGFVLTAAACHYVAVLRTLTG